MTPIAIAAGGMVQNVGWNGPASCAAIRAGIRNIGEANLYDPATAEPVPCARVELPQWWETTGKLAELVAPAILECLTHPDAPAPRELGVPDRARRAAAPRCADSAGRSRARPSASFRGT